MTSRSIDGPAPTDPDLREHWAPAVKVGRDLLRLARKWRAMAGNPSADPHVVARLEVDLRERIGTVSNLNLRFYDPMSDPDPDLAAAVGGLERAAGGWWKAFEEGQVAGWIDALAAAVEGLRKVVEGPAAEGAAAVEPVGDGPPVELRGDDEGPIVLGYPHPEISPGQRRAIKVLCDAYPKAIGWDGLTNKGGKGAVARLAELERMPNTLWKHAIGRSGGKGKRTGYRLLRPSVEIPSGDIPDPPNRPVRNP